MDCPPITDRPLQSPKTASFYVCDCGPVPLKKPSHPLPAFYANCAQTNCHNWLHCSSFRLWTANQQMHQKKNSAETGRDPNSGHVSVTVKHDTLFFSHGEEVKTRGLIQSDGRGIRDGTEKRGNKTLCVACFGSLMMMAHLQVTTHTPSFHKNRQKGAVVRRICCFTGTVARATTMSLPRQMKKRPRGGYAPRLSGRVERAVFDNEGKINRKCGRGE